MNWLTLYVSWWAVIPVLCGMWLVVRWLRRPKSDWLPWYARSIPLLGKWVRRHGRGR